MDGAKEDGDGNDVVTRIQSEVANLSSMYYNFTGGLQEMAPPVSVRGEIVKVESDTSVEYNAQELAKQIVDAHVKIDRLLDGLQVPQVEEEEQLRSLGELREQHEGMRAAYGEDVRRGARVLDALQDCYSVLAGYQLERGKFSSPDS